MANLRRGVVLRLLILIGLPLACMFFFVVGIWSGSVVFVDLNLLTPEDMSLEVTTHYWDRPAPNPLVGPDPSEPDVLIVEMTVSNHWIQPIQLICHISDAKGNTFYPSIKGNYHPGDQLMDRSIRVGETRQGKLAFELPKDDQGLQLRCGKNIVAQIQ